MNNRPNFFKMLCLDPGETSQSVILEHIEEKKKQCNRVRTDAPQAKIREADAFRIFEEEMKHVLCDQTLRKIEAAERRKQIKAEGKILDGMIKMLKSRGSYTIQDVKSIASKVPDVEEKDVEERIKRAGIREADPSGKKQPKSDPARPKTSGAEAAGIENDLKGLQLDSLYEFLGNETSKKSGQKLLETVYKSKKAELGQMVRGDAKHKVWSALLGHVRTHLHDPGNKERYDNYLDDRQLKTIDSFIKLRAGKSKMLTDEAIDDIVREAHLPNVTAERTIRYITEWVDRTKGWTLVVSSGFSLADLLTCGYCGTLAKKEGQQKCHDCGKPLRIPCPNRGCKAQVATESACCPQCGYSTGDAPYVEGLVKEAKRHLSGNGEAALRETELLGGKILEIWPNYQVALDILEEAKRIRSDRIAVDRERQQRERKSVDRLDRLVAARQLFEADRFSQQLKVDGLKVGMSTLQQISRGLIAAKKSRQHAARLLSDGRGDEAVDKLCEALAVCDDFEEVRISLEKIPPAAPVELQVERLASHNCISWEVATKRSDIHYVVTRSENAPSKIKDGGDALARVTGTKFDDTTADEGGVYYYSVYAIRGKVRSTEAATSKAVLRPGKLTGLAATAVDGEVCVTWNLPHGCREVRVTRNPGNVVKTIAGKELSEANLKIGETYSYSVVPLYDHPETGEAGVVRGAKRITEVIVARKPDPVNKLVAKIDGECVNIRWVPPAFGRVEIRLSPRAPTVEKGDIISVAEAKRIGGRLMAIESGKAKAKLPKTRQAYVVPITIEGSTAIVGMCAHVIDVPDVTNLRSHRKAPGRIDLTWEWPNGMKEVRVSTIRASDNKKLCTTEVTRGAYERNGNACSLTYAKAQVYLIVVNTKSPGNTFYSKGVSVTESLGEEMRIRYRVVSKNKTWYSKYNSRIELHWDRGNKTTLKDLIIVGRPDRLPTTISDGETIAEFKEVILNGTRLYLPIPEDNGFVGKLYLKLFLNSPERYPGVRLIPGSREQLILT